MVKARQIAPSPADVRGIAPNAAAVTTDEVAEADKDPNSVLIHFVDDGFTAFGSIWYRGQELAVKRDSDHWNESVDTKGASWLDLTEADQQRRYGRVYFREGPWPHERPDDGSSSANPAGIGMTNEEIIQRRKREQRAARAAPLG